MKRNRSKSHLSADEHALWSHVAQSIAPIRIKQRVTHHDDATDGDDGLPKRKLSKHHETVNRRPVVDAKAHTGSAVSPGSGTQRLADFDSRKARKIAKGRTEIEARLDLHGLRHDEAHHRLRHFLRDCHHRGLKHVLVITGKGRSDDDATLPFSEALDRPARGVLRRSVPRWLAEAELRAIVVSFTAASARHGGDGALYIELRRRL